MTYDLIIIGGGPAGVSAGVYSARKKLKTLILTSDFGGQSSISPDIHNWIGTKSISGRDLAKSLEDHIRAYESADCVIKTGQAGRVANLSQTGDIFSVETEDGSKAEGKAVVITAGSIRRKLEVPGANEYDQKGLTYCASCDGPMFADQDVVVIGGGNAGFESAAQLLAYCKSVTLLHKNNEFKADKITVDKVLSHPKMTAILNAEIVEVKGAKFVTSLVYKDKISGETKELPVTGIFVEIGFMPNTAFAKSILETNDFGAIKIDPQTQRTSLDGVWAAGDCTDALYHQNNIAAGDAVKAVEDVYRWLHLK
ncbi:MAG: NADH-dependent peroxiredoxin subunit [Patescibacteria group bacterium]|nr:NADH-dependent peroxiredoxin subunit [Patescibacteria group bacterium]